MFGYCLIFEGKWLIFKLTRTVCHSVGTPSCLPNGVTYFKWRKEVKRIEDEGKNTETNATLLFVPCRPIFSEGENKREKVSQKQKRIKMKIYMYVCMYIKKKKCCLRSKAADMDNLLSSSLFISSQGDLLLVLIGDRVKIAQWNIFLPTWKNKPEELWDLCQVSAWGRHLQHRLPKHSGP